MILLPQFGSYLWKTDRIFS